MASSNVDAVPVTLRTTEHRFLVTIAKSNASFYEKLARLQNRHHVPRRRVRYWQISTLGCMYVARSNSSRTAPSELNQVAEVKATAASNYTLGYLSFGIYPAN